MEAKPARRRVSGRSQAPSQSGYDAFISYSRRDLELAVRIQAGLEEKGLRIFRDQTAIAAGDRFVGALERGLEASRAVVFLVSRSTLDSAWVEDERNYALILANRREGGPRLIPILLDDTHPPGFLASRNGVDFRAAEDFAANVERLAAAIRDTKTGPVKAVRVPSQLRFLGFFPEGLLEVPYRELIRRKKLEKVANKARGSGLVIQTELRGVTFLGLDPAQVPGVRKSMSQPDDRAREVLDLLEACFAEEDPFADDHALGRGRSLLVRDLLGLLVAAGDDDDAGGRRERLRTLARGALPRMLDEGEARIALEVSDLLMTAFMPSPFDQLTHGRLLLELGQPRAAAELMALYIGEGDPFLAAGLSDRERIRFALDWGKAVKDSGQGKALHARVVEVFGRMIDLANGLLERGENGDLPLLRADLFNSRGTQLAVFGGAGDWPRAMADVDSAIRAYRSLGELDRLRGAEANLTSHLLDRGAPTRGDLEPRLAAMDSVEHDLPDVGEGSFFFLYQKARLLRRLGQEEAREIFEAAAGVAERSGLPRRAAIARWQVLRMRWEASDVGEEEYLAGLQECATELENAGGDAWSANTRAPILADVARARKNRKETDAAWDAAREALRLATSGLKTGEPLSDERRALLAEVIGLLKKIDPREPEPRLGRPLATLLKSLVKRPPGFALRWADLEGWVRTN